MAKVNHPCLARLLCVCMAQQMMMVTQLMPCGSLLEYVRDNQDTISCYHLLFWCTQIAQGMSYLEEIRLVHRDLAARNVLVKNPAQVKITDFGLSKFLDIQEEEYKSEGEKIAIKWMALECIKHWKFTHKSDVWSYGITIWELMTFGRQPFRHVPNRNFVNTLENGERPEQPPICSIEVYMLMVKCWQLEAEARPTFIYLAEKFSKMAEDPQKYLINLSHRQEPLPCPTREEFYASVSAEDDQDPMMDADDYLRPFINHQDLSLTEKDNDEYMVVMDDDKETGYATAMPATFHEYAKPIIEKDENGYLVIYDHSKGKASLSLGTKDTPVAQPVIPDLSNVPEYDDTSLDYSIPIDD